MVKVQPFQAPKGMHDILPQDQPWWDMVRAISETVARGYGFERIEPPIAEATGLFLRGIGENTDIVEKQMYSFKTRGGDALTLRPEFTASVVRAYIEHGMVSLPQPIKLWYEGPVFRHEAPGAGRYRELRQFGLETLGEAAAVLDAEIMHVLYAIFLELGLSDAMVHVNSIGDSVCRPAYRKTLLAYYRPRREKLCKDCKRRLTANPLRLFDCKVGTCRPLREDAPQILDHLCEPCHTHFREVIDFLDEAGLPYLLDPYLVRGLDYYTRTVFEYFVESAATEGNHAEVPLVPPPAEAGVDAPAGHPRANPSGGPLALAGGGRYDGLVELLGGKPTPAVGASVGMDRVVGLRRARGGEPRYPHMLAQPRLFLAQLGELGKKKGLKLFEELRRAGMPTAQAFSKDSLRVQLTIAARLGVPFTLILGQKEAIEGMVIVREMATGIQETIPLGEVVDALKKRLKR